MTSKDSEPEGDKANAPPVKEEEEQEEQQGETRPQPHAAPSPTAQGDDDKQAKPHHQETPQYPHQVPMMHPPASNSIELGRTWSETIFPMKLYDILCNPEFHHAISWMPHGRSWKVLNKDFFMEEICPQYFAQTRYESFIRQVNGWGFKRMRREGPDRSSYYHENFLRGYPNMIDHMRRPAPGEKSRDLREEPDFYAVPAMPRLPSPSERAMPSGGLRPVKTGVPKVGRSSGSSVAAPRVLLPNSEPGGKSSADYPPTPSPSAQQPYGQNPYGAYPGYGYPPQGYWGQPPPPPYHGYPPSAYPGYPPMSSPTAGGAYPSYSYGDPRYV
jgi:hypothetical protein